MPRIVEPGYGTDMPMTREYLAQLARKVAEGEAARRERAAIIRKLRDSDPELFTITVLAEMTGLTHQAISKIINKE